MRPTPDALMLFAAGFGTRMGALTERCPKPLLNIAGRALIDYALDLADDAVVSRIVINVRYRGDQIEHHLANRTSIAFSRETDTLLETGGGLKQARTLLGSDPIFTLNSDAVWSGPNPLMLLRSAWDPALMDALLLLVPRDRATGHTGTGDFVRADDGRLTRGPGLVYSGAQIITTATLNDISDRVFSLNRVWDIMAVRERLFGAVYSGHWCDVGQPDSIALAERLIGGPADA
jgi:N-acetyl-alpha-D-muramate 1-phosphate uridylyltransferase